MRLVSKSPEDTWAIAQKLAERILAKLPGAAAATVIALRGDLGAGKTTFTQGLARAFGIVEQPKSPTFLLAKQYAIPQTPYTLWHLDCYRLSSHADLVPLDLHTVFSDPHAIIVVEWPERIGDGLPRDRIEVHLTHEDAQSRGITIIE
jgi:tRNA threonylcarbamoyladenosine biosynthesis protein TsaE